jgi:hypothetical protein
MDQGDGVLSTPGGGLVQAHGAHLGVVLLGAGCAHIVLEHPPQVLIAHAQVPGDGRHRHGLAEP